ncbi:MAG: citN [Cyanobacteria bacterium RYN_339]|nr:citN [Cyanobacteria bacterium RYN_339]
MLTFLGFSMVLVFMTLIMTRRVTPLIALITVPVAFGLAGGFGLALGPMMLDGVKALAPTGVMLLFAILYFALMIDAGLFDPLVRLILRLVKGDPLRIVVGTALLALVVSLDGDGTTTYMITIAAMLPLYERLQLDRRVLACVVIMAAAITNIAPWGGPTARAASALGLSPQAVFIPLVPAALGCVGWLLFTAVVLGRRERARVGLQDVVELARAEDVEEHQPFRRPGRWWPNLLLTIGLMAGLMSDRVPLSVLFMLAFAAAALLNYPKPEEQKERVAAHAGNALAVVSLIFAAGIFTGILGGTKMVDAMAGWVIALIPAACGPYLTVITALVSIPFTFLISNDAFYFGMLPVLAKAAAVYHLAPADVARASIIGQQVHLLSPLVPSTYLLVGMAKVDIGDHQRFTLPWALGAAGVMLLGALATGAFPLAGH